MNGAVFDNDYKDFQARISFGPGGDLGLPTRSLSVVNAGKLTIHGAELEAAWTPITGLLIDTQIGYLDAEYKEFFDNRFPNHSRAFQTPAFSPKWTIRLGAQYGFDMGDRVDHDWRPVALPSRTALAIDNTMFFTRPRTRGSVPRQRSRACSSTATGCTMRGSLWEDVSKRFAVGLYGYNLSNKEYRTDAQEFSSSARFARSTTGRRAPSRYA